MLIVNGCACVCDFGSWPFFFAPCLSRQGAMSFGLMFIGQLIEF